MTSQKSPIHCSPAIHYAPIVLFVYNRPDHTRQTLEALAKNALASASDLFIYSDAAKKPEQQASVDAVREYISNVTGFNSITVIQQASNKGLATSIITGVTKICQQFGRVIVLEDDIVTSPWFLTYMNDALDFYQHTPEVMHISGCSYPVDSSACANTYFLHIPLCWGWATWDRAWQHFEKDIQVMNNFTRKMIADFNVGNTASYWRQLEDNQTGKLNTWFVFWYACVFLKNGLVLFPKTSLVNNIGMDNSGVHCTSSNVFNTIISSNPIPVTTIPLAVCPLAYKQHQKYFRSYHPRFLSRLLNDCRRLLTRFMP